jgi:ribosomal protein L29
MTARAAALDTLRSLSGEELALHLREQRGQLFQVRLQQTIGQVENHRQIRAIRKEIARTMTVQVEIRLAAERGEPAPAPRQVAVAAPGRRSRRAASAAAPTAPTAAAAVSLDAPVEEAISDVEIERIEPEVATPTKRRSRKASTADAVAPDEAVDASADTDHNDDEDAQ